ncbi:hypothetical protein [Acinetobacter variabilis]|uniref:Uncharacterized protein n=1 Tax=Acinetobacter variabilis TaxID=70346 RepID=N9NY82_9GAMM|nr:hypothetical protein [Acinetobacter variabilis]ENX07622.1 hypothetical protein F897_02658 [Acinetobacter variabilis]UBI31582.1 hypothetical protein LA331_05350 [Acinetobacter variabilis]
MVASTDIKFYVHTNNNAPQLQNAYGSMINVLDACLVNGINVGAVSSLIASGTTVTALFSSAHNLMQYQVIKITGANQSEFNGEHRVLTVPNAQSVTFELAAVPSLSTATGTITASLPPLAWEKPFSSTNPNGGGKAAYRSTNLLLPSHPFLRVVDELDPAYTATYAKYAKVGIVEDMTDIDTMLGVQAPFDSTMPDKNWIGTGSGIEAINGWARWYYATSYGFGSSDGDRYGASSNEMKWMVVGNGDWFYIINSSNEKEDFSAVYGFGSFESFLEGDSTNNFLISSLDYAPASENFYRLRNCPVPTLNKKTLLLQRDYTQNSSGLAAIVSLGIGKINNTSGEAIIGSPTSIGYALMPAYIYNSNIRGVLPALKWLYQSEPFSNKQSFIFGSEIFMAKSIAHPSSPESVQIVIKIGGL